MKLPIKSSDPTGVLDTQEANLLTEPDHLMTEEAGLDRTEVEPTPGSGMTSGRALGAEEERNTREWTFNRG